MKSKEEGTHSTKADPGGSPDPELADALRAKSPDGRIGCAQAFDTARSTGRSPAVVGKALDDLEIRITRCQLGLFGYTPNKKVVEPAGEALPDIEKDVLAALVNNALPCGRAWEIASLHRTPKMTVSAVCERLGIKISPCQLGAF